MHLLYGTSCQNDWRYAYHSARCVHLIRESKSCFSVMSRRLAERLLVSRHQFDSKHSHFHFSCRKLLDRYRSRCSVVCNSQQYIHWQVMYIHCGFTLLRVDLEQYSLKKNCVKCKNKNRPRVTKCCPRAVKWGSSVRIVNFCYENSWVIVNTNTTGNWMVRHAVKKKIREQFGTF